MPRKQRFKPSRKPKPTIEEANPMGTQVAPPMIPKDREQRDDVRGGDRNDVVIDHDRPR
ncbi:MAG: hypothetical protein SFX73_23555 [Kofleriaceae bacterium]|nr:hypothetical protein [Kofleriaceae bacterium]